MTDDLLFVYGTLRRDTRSGMHRLLAQYASFLAGGTYQGRLYLVGNYPGVVPSPNPSAKVRGEVYALHRPEIILPKLDAYEECGPDFSEPTEYLRQRQAVVLANGSTCHAWVYLYNRPTDKLILISSGDFLA